MSGECQICNEHCLDCKCGNQILGCDPNTNVCSPAMPLHINVLGDEGYETYARNDGNIGVRPKEKINHPSHYKGKRFEAIDVIEDFELDFNLGNVIKYILRSHKKDDYLQDLKKALWYLQREIENHEN